MAEPDVSATIAAIEQWRDRIREATIAAARESAEHVRDEIRAKLEQSHYPPSSDPGTPPAYRTGWLQQNVYITEMDESLTGIQERIFPSTVYARIQELGGITGAGHRTHLPPRPYVGPVRDEAPEKVREIFVERWTSALPRG